MKSAFEKMFEPFGDGYVYRAGRRGGGKFVSREEFEALRAQHRRMMRWVTVIMVGMVVAGHLLIVFLRLPEAFSKGLVWLDMAIGIFLIAWTVYAPARLVKGREVIAPPRPLAEARRVARGMIRWPMVIGVAAVSALVLASCLAYRQYTLEWWLWTIGAAAMFLSYLWIAVRKLQDQ